MEIATHAIEQQKRVSRSTFLSLLFLFYSSSVIQLVAGSTIHVVCLTLARLVRSQLGLLITFVAIAVLFFFFFCFPSFHFHWPRIFTVFPPFSFLYSVLNCVRFFLHLVDLLHFAQSALTQLSLLFALVILLLLLSFYSVLFASFIFDGMKIDLAYDFYIAIGVSE